MTMMHKPGQPGELLKNFSGTSLQLGSRSILGWRALQFARFEWPHCRYDRPQHSVGRGSVAVSRFLFEGPAAARSVD